MAFDVGAVVAHLQLDKKQWEQSIAAVKKDQTSLQGFVLNNEKEIKKLGTSLTVAGGAITGMFGLLLKGSVDAGHDIDELSKRTGIGAATLSAYKLAADKSGTSLEGVALGMRNMANQMQAANDGGKAAQVIWEKLGVTYVDGAGKLRPLDQMMLDVADKFAGMEDGAAKSALAVDLFGRSGMELIPFLNLGKKGLEENAAAAHQLGIVWSQEAAAKANEFKDSTVELKAGLAGLGREIISPLMPAIKDLIEDAKGAAMHLRGWAAEHPTLVSWIAKATLGLGLLMGVIGPLLIALPGLVKGFQALKTLDIGTKLAKEFEGGTAAIDTLSKGLKALPLVAAAAFAGWNLGKYIGEITGYNKVAQESWGQLIDKLGLFKGSAEAADLSSDRLAKRQLFLSTASQIAGKDITDLNEAINIIKAAYEKSGTVGNKTLDDWAKKSTDADAATRKLSGGVGNLAKLLEEFGIKTRTELVKQLEDAKSALDQLQKSGEATPGAIKALQDKIKDLTEQLYGVDKAGKEFTNWLDGLVPKMSECSAWLRKVDDLYAQGKISEAQYGAAMKDLTDKFDKLGVNINRILPPARDMKKALDEVSGTMENEPEFFDSARDALVYWSRELDTSTDKVAELVLANLNLQTTLLQFQGFGPILPSFNFAPMIGGAKNAARETKSIMQEVSTVVSDMMRDIAKSVTGLFDLKGLFGAKPITVKFDDSGFVAMTKAAQAAYDKIRGLAETEYDQQELQISRAQEDEDRRYKYEYDLKVKAINDSSMTEEQKQAALTTLENQYEEAKLARDRAREDAKYAREQAQKQKLLDLETAHELDLQKIKDDEDKARQKLADDEEKRQNSLWFKVKGIVATAFEDIGTIFLTKLLEPVGKKIGELAGKLVGKGLDTVTGALDKTGEHVGTLGGTIGDFISGIGKGIGGFISGLAKGVGEAIIAISSAISTAIVTLATGIASAATILAAAAPALLIVGGIALALFAGFSLISSLFSKGGGNADDATYWLKLIKDNTQILVNYISADFRGMLQELVDGKNRIIEQNDGLKTSTDLTRDAILSPLLGQALGWLSDISGACWDVSSKIGHLKGASLGAILTSPQLIMTHGTETDPEYVIRKSQLPMTEPRLQGSAASRPVTVNLAVHIDGQMITDGEYARQRLLPEMLAAINSNVGGLKSRLQQALGVA